MPQGARDVFTLLCAAGWIVPPLAEAMKRMIGFRNIAVHDYQSLQLPITVAIIEGHLNELREYGQAVPLGDAGAAAPCDGPTAGSACRDSGADHRVMSTGAVCTALVLC